MGIIYPLLVSMELKPMRNTGPRASSAVRLSLVDEVFVRDLNCSCADPIKLLYYSAKYDPICIYCAKDELFTNIILNVKIAKDKPPIAKK